MPDVEDHGFGDDDMVRWGAVDIERLGLWLDLILGYQADNLRIRLRLCCGCARRDFSLMFLPVRPPGIVVELCFFVFVQVPSQGW